jgi:hypothetical protein
MDHSLRKPGAFLVVAGSRRSRGSADHIAVSVRTVERIT